MAPVVTGQGLIAIYNKENNMSYHAPLIIDIAGCQLNKADKKRLKHPLVGGLILFARNWESREQLTELCASIKKSAKIC